MLSPEYRLRSSTDFGRTVRGGRKKGSRSVVVYILSPSVPYPEALARGFHDVSRETLSPDAVALSPHPRVGLVVSKAVGNAVARHRISRLLRHAARDALVDLERECAPGTTIVLRALPAAASTTYKELVKDVYSCIRRAL
ncbi:ribonuclease P protein component [Corynebacterium auriscanis]|uniref:ribonuclease P protein component n=1 Tax=Corynebacterium auriscanis TaxID=99807 RepID=UPI0024AE4656|nr:ribonuclease P protein component [Corynebacterium auriscanis]